MTVIAAIARHGTVWMAADHIASNDDRVFPAVPKVMRLNTDSGRGPEVVVGVSGNQIAAGLLQRCVLPAPGPDLDGWALDVALELTRYLWEDVKPALGCRPDSEGPSEVDACFLLGHAGRLWYVDTNAATPARGGVAAIGNGGPIALGYLEGMCDARQPLDGPWAEAAAVGAVRSACRWNTLCQLLDDDPTLEVLEHA